MRFLNLILILLMWTEAVFAVSTTDNNKVVGKTLKVADKFVSGTNFVNGDFEDSPITGWTVAHSSLTSLIPTSTTTAGTALSVGTGLTAATNLAITATSTNPLAGSYSGLLTASATSTAGDLLISPAISIPNSAKAKMITIGFSYSASSAINLSGTASNSFAVYVYDIDNATWIQPAGTYGMIDGSTYAQVKNITFQTSSNGTKYQLAIVNINSIAAYTLKIDEVYFGTQAYSSGAAMSDWKTGSCASSWTTNATTTCKYRRIGDSAEIQYYIYLSDAPNAAILQVYYPSGLSVDLSKETNTDYSNIIGKAGAARGGNGTILVPYFATSSLFTIAYDTGSGTFGAVTNSAPSTWGNTDIISATVIVPISGWSSNTVQSADTDTRIVSYSISGSEISGQTISNTTTQLLYSSNGATLLTNTHGGGSSNQYKIPVSGYYYVMAGVDVGYTGTNTTYTHTLKLYKNGFNTDSVLHIGRGANTLTSVPIDSIQLNNTYYFNAGDILTLWFTTDYSSDVVYVRNFSVSRVTGPAVVQASESVNGRVYGASGTTMSANTPTLQSFSTKDFDSHNAFTTNALTIPVSGKYQINAVANIISNTWGAVAAAWLHIYKNGVLFYTTDALQTSATAYIGLIPKINNIFNFKQGDIVQIYTSGNSTNTMMTTSIELSWSRVGN